MRKGKSMFVDVHAHLCDEKFNNLEEIVENAKREKVEKIISASYNFASCEKNLEIAENFENVFITVGIHPENVDEIEEDFPNNFKKIDTKSLPNKDLILRVIEKDLCRYKKYAEILFCLMMTLGVLFLITAFF